MHVRMGHQQDIQSQPLPHCTAALTHSRWRQSRKKRRRACPQAHAGTFLPTPDVRSMAEFLFPVFSCDAPSTFFVGVFCCGKTKTPPCCETELPALSGRASGVVPGVLSFLAAIKTTSFSCCRRFQGDPREPTLLSYLHLGFLMLWTNWDRQ